MRDEITQKNMEHPFTLPVRDEVIISAATGISYQIGDPFDSGYFGTVFECSDDWGHSLVAKILRPVGPQQEMEGRATQEFVASHIVRSPHIVHAHDAFVYKGAFYIISERCLTTLRTLIEKKDSNPELLFKSLAKGTLNALHFMHTRGLIHCDVHPGNIFLHEKKDVILPNNQSALDFKLGDFGQTRAFGVDHLNSTWNLSCRPPEAINPEFGNVDHRADIYQAWLLFLQFLTRELLTFTEAEVLAGKPRQSAENLRHPAAFVVASMLRRHVEYRPHTALEAWKAFAPIL
jgi:eukaryotic-like serine/threonine-protein kinase